ncbi:MAG: hypothetical protein M1817_003415 [Caeruleum heppii]|nr:MAG: hypothetical protein M1817_003415 [Caeruleum heppii]
MVSDKPDGIRARELSKYFRPICPSPNIEGRADAPASAMVSAATDYPMLKGTSPDTALTAFAQLVAWRLNAKRAMISLFGRDTQYVIAESTKSLNLAHNDHHDVGDGLWLGCEELMKEDGLCEGTVALTRDGFTESASRSQHAFFIVPDLSQDDRFRDRPYVAGAPFLRFYAGTPITTKRGINIGSLCVVDDQPREHLTREQMDFFGIMATNIMNNLAMSREAELRRRGLQMSRALATFIGGGDHLSPDDDEGMPDRPSQTHDGPSDSRCSDVDASQLTGLSLHPDHRAHLPTSMEASTASDASALACEDESGNLGTADPAASASRESVQTSSAGTTQSEAFSTVVDAHETTTAQPSHHATFARAAKLLQQSLEVDGVVFLDTTVGFYDKEGEDDGTEASADKSPGQQSVDSDRDPDDNVDAQPTSGDAFSPVGASSGRVFNSSSFSRAARRPGTTIMSPLLAEHVRDAKGREQVQADAPELQMPENLVQLLLKRYPTGKLWAFDEDGTISSSDEDYGRRQPQPGTSDRKGDDYFQRRRTRSKWDDEAKRLMTVFEGTRQLMFVPLTESGSSRWIAGCLAWTRQESPAFTTDVDLAFLRAFISSVGTEITRIDSVAADKQKSSFISSISHELRSPLHGILGAVDFLCETNLDTFQRGLVDSIHSCGSTLHETLTSVLSYAKINSFQQNQMQASRRRAEKPGSAFEQRETNHVMGDGSANGLFTPTNIAVLCEEMVEMVEGGHFYRDNSDIAAGADQGSSGPYDQGYAKKLMKTTRASETEIDPLTVVLDIEFHEDWSFVTQPGALRRIMMNIIGNSLKYCAKGYVKVNLGIVPARMSEHSGGTSSSAKELVQFQVIDTGKGISRDFLQSRLFTPFAQENAIASPGVGLGLSIVRSLVSMLGGKIDVKSQVGKGTEVTVCIPMVKTASANPHAPEAAIPLERAVALLRQKRQTVLLHGFPPLVRDSLATYVLDWFNYRLVEKSLSETAGTDEQPHLVVVNETESWAFFEEEGRNRLPDAAHWPAVLIICLNNARWHKYQVENQDHRVVERIPQPFGAVKLSKALLTCVQKLDALGVATVINPAEGGLPQDRKHLESLRRAVSETKEDFVSGLDMDGVQASIGKDMTPPSDPMHPDTPVQRPSSWLVRNEAGNRESAEGLGSVENADIRRQRSANGSASPGLGDAKPRPLSIRSAQHSSEGPISFLNSPTTSHKRPDANLGETSSSEPPRKSPRKEPRLLLVDDNKINLRLLAMCIKRRGYAIEADTAENGLLAVQAVETCAEGYDIIFMDLSMPVMDGLAATRAIRAFERRRATSTATGGAPSSSHSRSSSTSPSATASPGAPLLSAPKPALIIAVTGLASSRDQNEAFASGIDLFMTKPVKFRELGEFLDRWEADAMEPTSRTSSEGRSSTEA